MQFRIVPCPSKYVLSFNIDVRQQNTLHGSSSIRRLRPIVAASTSAMAVTTHQFRRLFFHQLQSFTFSGNDSTRKKATVGSPFSVVQCGKSSTSIDSTQVCP